MLRSILCLNQSICNSPSSFRNSNNRSVGQSLFPENGPKNFVGRSSWAQTSFQDTTILSLAWRAIGILQLLAERSSQTFQRSDIHILTLTFWLAIHHNKVLATFLQYSGNANIFLLIIILIFQYLRDPMENI